MSKFQINQRPRRLRANASIRAMVEETILKPSDFIAPLFVEEGTNKKTEIASMPGYYRFSIDNVLREIESIAQCGIRSLLLFVKVDDSLKDNTGKEAINNDGLMQRAIIAIKKEFPELLLMTDVALDPYSEYGHDGIIKNGTIDNDLTLESLAQMALSHAQAGADWVAPSDMMDGRIRVIRETLDQNQYTNCGIMAYSAKYASSFYGPFRDALDSAPVDSQGIPRDKKTYQMNPSNSKEAVREVLLDIEEGADMVMVKPAGCYLDIIKQVSEISTVPVSAYQVSGEYAMIKAAASNGWLSENEAMMESLIAIKRAGADVIATYFAKEASALILNNKI